jgi:hypothetical protein
MPLSAADLRRSASPSATAEPTRLAPHPPPPGGGTVGTDTSAFPGWEEMPDGRGGVAFKRTFHLVGGDLTVLSDAHEAKVLSSRPKPGFVLLVTHFDVRTILASLVSTTHASRVLVGWHGAPSASVTET